MKERRTLPGFGLSLGITSAYLGLVVLIPLATLPLVTAHMPFGQFLQAAFSPRTLAAYRLSVGASFVAALVNAAAGFLVAWVLERYSFPGKRLVDGFVDLPFALPTAVAGIALTTLYADNGWVGAVLSKVGVHVAYSPIGIVFALIFVGLPFVVRTVQPVLHELPASLEEAAATLGAGRLATFRRVLLPQLLPAVATGFTLTFARGLGEYGSVIFIAGNLPMKSEITPLLIMIRLEEFDYRGATAIALTFLMASFALLLLTNALSMGRRTSRA